MNKKSIDDGKSMHDSRRPRAREFIRAVARVVLEIVMASQIAGCATIGVDHYYTEKATRIERFYPKGPVREYGDCLYVQGVTKRIKGYADPYWQPAPVLKENASYVVFVATNYCLGRAKWIDPGSLPDEVLNAGLVRMKIGGRVFPSEEFSPGLGVLYHKYLYSSGDSHHYIVFQSPEDAKKSRYENHSYDVPRFERRLPDDYTWCDRLFSPIVYSAAIVFDVVTSPLQLIGLSLAFSHFSI